MTAESLTSTIVGTRGSELALVQATATEAALAAAFPDREIVRSVIKTTGDRRTDVSLSEVAKSEGTFDMNGVGPRGFTFIGGIRYRISTFPVIATSSQLQFGEQLLNAEFVVRGHRFQDAA